MRRDYWSLYEIDSVNLKRYFMYICQGYTHLEEKLYCCFTKHDLLKWFYQENVYDEVFELVVQAYQQAQGLDEIEYHLIIMNVLFSCEKTKRIKKQLLNLLCKRRITLNEYCLMRHLVDFSHISFKELVYELYQCFGVDAIECAKICLLEDHVDEACFYLKMLRSCEDDNVLYVLKKMSLIKYISVMNFYRQQRKDYSFVTGSLVKG